MNNYLSKLSSRTSLFILFISNFSDAESTPDADNSTSSTMSNWLSSPTKLQKLFDENKRIFPNATNLPTQEEAFKEYKPPSIASKSAPIYPDILRRRGIEGKVYVALLISEEGNVIDALIAHSTNKNLDEAALESTKTWKFTPALVGNTPKQSVAIAPLEFQLNKEITERNNPPTFRQPVNPVLPNLQYIQ